MKKNQLSLLILFIVLFASQFITYSQIPSNELSAKSETTPIHNPSINSPPLPGALDPLWTKTFGGPNREEGSYVIEVSGGGYAILGTKDMGAINHRDFWLIRTDANGNELWNQTYGGTGWDVARNLVEVSTGGFALIGVTESYGAGGDDIWLVRVDAAGNHLWNTTFGGSGDDNLVYAVVEASAGGFAIPSGTDRFSPGNRDAWLIRTDSSGNELWNQTYGGPQDDWADYMVEASGGGFTLQCTTTSFGAGGQDSWLVHTDASGNHQWNQTYGWSGNEISTSIIEVSGGGYAFAAITRSFDSYGDTLFVRTDATGNHLWNQTFGGTLQDVLFGIDELSNGEFVLAGWSTSFGAPERDLWVVRTDISGNLYWHHTYGGSQQDYGLLIHEVTGGGFIVSGQTESFGGGLEDIWLLRLPDPDIWWVTEPSNRIQEFGPAFSYDTTASAFTGIDEYWLNDTSTFAIDGTGLITNSTPLAVNIYRLQLWANDTLDNRINANITITIEAAAPPAWVQTPTDQTLELGQDLSYNLDATDRSGLDTWWINDTTTFAIDNSGLITNTIALAVGVYGLQVSVNDTLGYIQSASFTVAVEDTTDPEITTTQTEWYFDYGVPVTGVIIEATDLDGIDHWTLSDTTNFNFTVESSTSTSISITNILPLNPSTDYSLDITAFDPSGNSDTFSITISIGPGGIPGFPIAAVALGLLLSTGTIMFVRRRKRRLP
ncbi:MAG: hypothetical protein ACFFCF_07940 [Promethearchaeota archaeon]